MLKVLIAAFDDGVAFVSEAEALWMVRPPYGPAGRTATNSAELQRALKDPGFRAVEKTFLGWDAVFEFLGTQFVEHAGRAVPAPRAAGAALLRHATRETLERYLRRVEHELIPAAEWASARELLRALGATEKVRADEALEEWVVRLRSLIERGADVKPKVPTRREPLMVEPPTIMSRLYDFLRPELQA